MDERSDSAGSTFKMVVVTAALEEGIIESRSQALLVSAMARSSNWYFANLGAKLGFERVRRYARMLGLGEKAGLNIPEEQSGVLPSAPPKYGGVGMMTSFGAGIAQTPLELAAMLLLVAIVAAITLTLRRRPGYKQQDISAQVAVRAIAAHIEDKKTDPAVVVVDAGSLQPRGSRGQSPSVIHQRT